MKCPCCNGTGEIAARPPVRLTPMQRAVWEALRRSPDGLPVGDLTARVYGDRPDGGPISGTHCVWAHVHTANKRLATIGQRITASGGPGSIYRLEQTP